MISEKAYVFGPKKALVRQMDPNRWEVWFDGKVITQSSRFSEAQMLLMEYASNSLRAELRSMMDKVQSLEAAIDKLDQHLKDPMNQFLEK